MAIPSTGALALVSCPNGNCSSISGVVCGSSVGVSLLDMGAKIGMGTSGIYMGNFRGSILGDLIIYCPTLSSIPNGGGSYNICTWSVTPNTFTVSDACTWITTTIPEPPSPTHPGSLQGISIAANGGAARSGTICYDPIHCGATQYVCVCQLAGVTNCLTLSCGDIEFTWVGGTCQIFVYANAGNSWTAVEAAGFLSVLNAAGTGNGSFCIRSVKNAGGTQCFAWVCVNSSAAQQRVGVTTYSQYMV